MLAQRLRDLEAAGIVRRRELPPPAASTVYELTAWGLELDPILIALGAWGTHTPVEADARIGADSTMLQLRSTFGTEQDQDWSATIEVRLGRDRFVVRVVDGNLAEVRRGEADRPDATVTSDPDTVRSILDGDESFVQARTQGRLTIDGDVPPVRRLLRART